MDVVEGFQYKQLQLNRAIQHVVGGMSLDSLDWRERFVEETPGDSVSGVGLGKSPVLVGRKSNLLLFRIRPSDYGRMNWLRS